MPLQPDKIFEALKDIPHRGCGTEAETSARVILRHFVEQLPGVDCSEESFRAPSSYVPFLWLVFMGSALALVSFEKAPVAAGFMAAALAISYFLFLDWRFSPLAWLPFDRRTANLVASRGSGEHLIILMAHLDSAPASYAYRASQIRKFGFQTKFSLYLVLISAFTAVLYHSGVMVPDMLRFVLVGGLGYAAIIAAVDYLRCGYVPGANDNLTGVSAATTAASRLWETLPPNCEVRLVITSAEEAGMLGAQYYLREHRSEFAARPVSLVNIDTVGQGKLAWVKESGGFTRSRYNNQLTEIADSISVLTPFRHMVGDFDSVWFNRAGIDAITLAAYDDDGMMPHIHTMDDTAEKIDQTVIVLAARMAENIIRERLGTIQ